MEEFVRAEVNSYDAIIDAHGNPIFEAGNVSPVSVSYTHLDVYKRQGLWSPGCCPTWVRAPLRPASV